MVAGGVGDQLAITQNRLRLAVCGGFEAPDQPRLLVGEALLRAVPGDMLGALEYPLYLCAVMTGLRQGELLALKWLDVDWTAGRVRVADNYPRGFTGEVDSHKSHYLRSVPMADRLAGELERHFQRSAFHGPHDLVFCHPQTNHVLDASKLRSRLSSAARTERSPVARRYRPRGDPERAADELEDEALALLGGGEKLVPAHRVDHLEVTRLYRERHELVAASACDNSTVVAPHVVLERIRARNRLEVPRLRREADLEGASARG